MTQHVVEQGETVATIARKHGVTRESIIQASDNAELFRTRTPRQLFEGDEVFVPDMPPKSLTLATDRTHTIVVRPRTTRVRVRFMSGGAPRSSEPCRVVEDGGASADVTLDDGGWLDTRVSVEAKVLEVTFFPDTDYAERATLNLGHLDPACEARGLQQRLNNLGFACGAEDGDAADRTRAALWAFQATHGDDEPSGEIDDATTDALVRKHLS